MVWAPQPKSHGHSGIVSYLAVQGEAMGRPGFVNVILHIRGDRVDHVQVSGEAVFVPSHAKGSS